MRLFFLSVYLYFNYFIKIVPFWLRNIRFLIQNTRSLFYGRHYSSLHSLMLLYGKLNVKFFLMFIVAENTGSVTIEESTYLLKLTCIDINHRVLVQKRKKKKRFPSESKKLSKKVRINRKSHFYFTRALYS